MKTIVSFVILIVLVLSCNNENLTGVVDRTDPANSVIYQLEGVSNSNISGEATFARNQDNSTTIFVRLVGASDNIHPASINFNEIAQGGNVAIRLNSCECLESETVVSQLDNGTSIDFDELVEFNGHLNIYESESLSDLIIAQTNIGSNAQ